MAYLLKKKLHPTQEVCYAETFIYRFQGPESFS